MDFKNDKELSLDNFREHVYIALREYLDKYNLCDEGTPSHRVKDVIWTLDEKTLYWLLKQVEKGNMNNILNFFQEKAKDESSTDNRGRKKASHLL